MLLLIFETTASWNMHHDFGASSERRSTAVTIRLAEDGSVEVTDIGSDRFGNLHRDGRHTEEVTQWSSAWSGTWTRTESALTLRLSPTAESCTHDGQPCPVPGALLVTCERAALPLEPAAEGWRCAMTGAPHTAGPWLLVEGRCVEQGRGRFSGPAVSWCEEQPSDHQGIQSVYPEAP